MLNTNNNINHFNPDFYQSHLMISHPTLPPQSYSPYTYFPPSHYLTKPMPLMSTSNSGALPPHPTYIFPPELPNNTFFRNQTYPSPPPSISSSVRTNNTQYQNGNKTKLNNDQQSISNDASKTLLTNNYSTPIRTKSR